MRKVIQIAVSGKGAEFFTAVPTETEEQRDRREVEEAEDRRMKRITALLEEITAKQNELEQLREEGQPS